VISPSRYRHSSWYSKLTICRRWPTKAAIVTEAFLDQASSKFSLSFPDTGGVVDEFRRQMRACVKLLTSPYGKLLSTLLGGIQIDGQLAEAFRLRWLEPRRREAKEVLRRGIDRGEPPPGIDQEALIDALYRPLYFRLLFGD
jgi:Tetracyclin repressor-like, C-terminal domain